MSAVIIVTILSLMGIALYTLLITRNLLKCVIALQILVKGAMLAIIFAGTIADNMDLAQSMALTVIVADTIVAVIGLAMAIQIKHLYGTVDVKSISSLRR